MKIAHVSTFPPLRCGIANFASDLIESISEADHVRYSLHYGMNSTKDVLGSANVMCPDQIITLAKSISISDCDLISLQHEFGIWGGKEGENIFPFLDNVSKPIVSILHTTFSLGVRSATQSRILERLVQQSTRIVVFTDIAKQSLEALLKQQVTNAVVIPHGVPDVSFESPQLPWGNNNEAMINLRLITPGFFREDKGLETILLALWRLKHRGQRVSYIIAGEPQHQFTAQRKYYSEIEQLIQVLDLASMVTIQGRYLSLVEQVKAIQECHVGIFAYQTPIHASSGTVPLVLACGRPVICTPFEYAISKSKELSGVMVTSGFSATSIADAITEFMNDRDGYPSQAKSVYDNTRRWVWKKVGLAYYKEYQLALQSA